MMQAIPSSFRDNSGYVFCEHGIYYRAIHTNYFKQYQQLMQSGLYEDLVRNKQLISHTEQHNLLYNKEEFLIIKPELLTTISYAYEWSFSMLKDAALCTLSVALKALEYNMILKDANTYNIQFLRGNPLLIDTLSFEQYIEGESWIAYKQFCEHFLAPLVLMKYCNSSLQKLLLSYPNGIPLEVCAALLPLRARFNLNTYLHIFLQSNISAKPNQQIQQNKQKFSKQKLLTLLNGLRDFVSSLDLTNKRTTWDNYYAETILSEDYLNQKKQIVSAYLTKISFTTLIDLGANDGEFSKLYKNTEKQIIALDADRNCIERLYLDCKNNKISNIHPFIVDLLNPSPALGWNNEERPSLLNRVQADVTLALALIHHLAIANNIPLAMIVDVLAKLSPYLIIEFIAKEDPKVIQLLANRKDIFIDYTIEHFKECLEAHYNILEESSIPMFNRTLFLLKRKS